MYETCNKLCCNCRHHDAAASRCMKSGLYITGAESLTQSCVLWSPNQVIRDELVEQAMAAAKAKLHQDKVKDIHVSESGEEISAAAMAIYRMLGGKLP